MSRKAKIAKLRAKHREMRNLAHEALLVVFESFEVVANMGHEDEASEAYFEGSFLRMCKDAGLTPPEPTWDTSFYTFIVGR